MIEKAFCFYVSVLPVLSVSGNVAEIKSTVCKLFIGLVKVCTLNYLVVTFTHPIAGNLWLVARHYIVMFGFSNNHQALVVKGQWLELAPLSNNSYT